MKKLVVGCYSTQPNRQYDAVVFTVDHSTIRHMEQLQASFNNQRLNNQHLYRHEFRTRNLYLIESEYMLDEPGNVTPLDKHLRELEIEAKEVSLTKILNGYLSVIDGGFFYNWDGRREKNGPSEEYESQFFTLNELRAAYGD